MKAKDVPQDHSALFDGHTKAVYARDEQGHYTTVETTGWSAEETATRLAVESFEEALADARAQCERGEIAPLAFHMCARRMDIPTLAEAAGIAKWRVRRHMRPQVFARLGQRILRRYAEALQLSQAALARLPEISETVE